MALEVGSRLGHYDVTALIGEGGMGQVYRATDTKLNRQVALKILPEAFASDPDRLARFQREAQVLASLNHPSIAQIHGLEESEGTRALVLELVEGPTLADRIAKGAIPFDEALPIARQIAEALEAAHEAGVIHRDLKPANIKVKDDGTVKVLDFGLAKALDTTHEGDPSQSPTLTAAATQMGVIMGTAAYMSPEQASGKPVDKRSDIWAFGAVLFEMLTGQRTFGGEDVSHTVAHVLTREVDWTALPANLPTPFLRLLNRCLDRDPKRRLRDIGEARIALADPFRGEAGETRHILPSGGAWRSILTTAVVLAAVGIGAAGGRLLSPARDAQNALTSFVVSPRPRVESFFGVAIAVSPDGRQIAYVGSEDVSGVAQSLQQIFLRRLDELEARPVPRTEGAYTPFFSPDGRWLGFFSGSRLMKVPVSGGPPVEVTTIPSGRVRGASWGDNDVIVFSPSASSGLMRVSASGGTPEAIAVVGENRSLALRWQHMAL